MSKKSDRKGRDKIWEGNSLPPSPNPPKSGPAKPKSKSKD
jgi:hypothetical protein